MKIVDKTPYRTETGEIDLLGRVQGMLKYGMSWYSRLKAQDVVIAIIEKQLDSNYALLRNVTLPNTEINLPFVLIGPPGIYLINVTHERGVFIARDDQWGTMIGDRFVGARINQIGRTLAFGRVLQLYLDRQGFKGSVVVESILMAADPGMQIESTRPAVRVVMSDALQPGAQSPGRPAGQRPGAGHPGRTASQAARTRTCRPRTGAIPGNNIDDRGRSEFSLWHICIRRETDQLTDRRGRSSKSG